MKPLTCQSELSWVVGLELEGLRKVYVKEDIPWEGEGSLVLPAGSQQEGPEEQLLANRHGTPEEPEFVMAAE